MEHCIAAIATPPGSGGLAVIRISGENAIELAASLLRFKNQNKSLKNTPGYTAVHAELWDEAGLVDEVVALVFRAPHSYTGEDTVEISCHGGAFLSQRVLAACLAAGAEMAAAGEFTRRAFMNGKLSLAQAEAVVELIEANSQQQISGATQVLAGKLNREINQIKSALIAEAAHIAAWIDYPEEDVPAVDEQNLMQIIAQNRKRLAEMLEEYQQYTRIKRGFRVVILGRPNVGKSSLFNLLVGSGRAITTPVAGTTRDVLSEEIWIDGCPVQLCDTAGLRESQDLIEAEGIRRTTQELQTADILLCVAEAADADPWQELRNISSLDKPVVYILNKSDEADAPPLPGGVEALLVSATRQPDETARMVREALGRILQISPVHPDAMLLASNRQQQEAKKACQFLEEIETEQKYGLIYDITYKKLEMSIEALSALTGENASNTIIDDVFSRFCVGK